jgi:hypothetical protein
MRRAEIFRNRQAISSCGPVRAALTVAGLALISMPNASYASSCSTDLLGISAGLGVYMGSGCSTTSEDEVYLHKSIGDLAFGRIGSQHATGPAVEFRSDATIDAHKGFSTITPDGPTYNELTIKVRPTANDTYTFDDLAFDIELRDPTLAHGKLVPVDLTLSISAYDAEDKLLGTLTLTNKTTPALSSGTEMNFFIDAETSDLISKVIIMSSTGFEETGDFEISGLTVTSKTGLGGLNATPLPAAFPLLASGIGAIGLFGWRKRKKQAEKCASR